MSTEPSQRTGVILILCGALAVGLMPSAAKIAYHEGANPLAVILLRSIIGVIGIGLYLWIKKYRFNISWREFRFSSVTGIAQSFCSLGIMASIAYINLSLAMVIIFCFPFWVLVYNHFRGTSKLTPIIMGCFFLALLGLSLALGLELGEMSQTGLSLAVMGMFSMAAMVIIVAHSSTAIGPIPANFYMTCWTFVYFLIIAFSLPKLGIIDPASYPQTIRGWIAIVGTGASFSFGYVLFFVGASIIGTTRASLLCISEPIMIILVAVLLVDERLDPIQWLGISLVIGSLMVIELPKKKRPGVNS